ncbi:hypothetical protein CPB83DRAFT_894364 [Crepidotus variabilis]|uniref:Uncharacterized protein n=1 Tax=Crepidotus variabilis TaxID=179855 RepID=A0A9P6EH19_9AGAR|nr:hypothetical protein CPB83DRAFT_894364 [Crepidotus variabilis]
MLRLISNINFSNIELSTFRDITLNRSEIRQLNPNTPAQSFVPGSCSPHAVRLLAKRRFLDISWPYPLESMALSPSEVLQHLTLRIWSGSSVLQGSQLPLVGLTQKFCFLQHPEPLNITFLQTPHDAPSIQHRLLEPKRQTQCQPAQQNREPPTLDSTTTTPSSKPPHTFGDPALIALSRSTVHTCSHSHFESSRFQHHVACAEWVDVGWYSKPECLNAFSALPSRFGMVSAWPRTLTTIQVPHAISSLSASHSWITLFNHSIRSQACRVSSECRPPVSSTTASPNIQLDNLDALGEMVSKASLYSEHLRYLLSSSLFKIVPSRPSKSLDSLLFN